MKVKMLNFSFFSKSALGKIFYLIVLGLYTHELDKNAKKRIVISFLSQTLCETVVSCSFYLHLISTKFVLSYSRFLRHAASHFLSVHRCVRLVGSSDKFAKEGTLPLRARLNGCFTAS